MRESIGARLRSTRERRGLTIAQVSESIRVRSHYLQALENDDLSAMPSTAQARGFLRNYTEFLGLEINEGPAGNGIANAAFTFGRHQCPGASRCCQSTGASAHSADACPR